MSLLKDKIAAKRGLGPFAARIRPGLKVPTKKAREAAEKNPALDAVFKRVEEGSLSSREAERQILSLTNNGLKFPFTPKNFPFFSIKETDFSSPVLGKAGVKLLLDKWGEEREGFPGKKLWRIPMVFADVNDVEKIFPSEYAVGQGPNLYRSMYINAERHCMIRVEVEKGAGAKRKHLERIPVSRGLCDPELCAEFGSGSCKFKASLRFHIPEFPGVAPFIMETTSTYAAEDMYRQLEQVIEKLGRVPRQKPDGSPVFWLVKSQKTRTYFDENGEKKSGLQWVPDLIADIDFPKLLEMSDRQALISVDRQAVPQAWMAAQAGVTAVASREMTVSGVEAGTSEPEVVESNIEKEPVQQADVVTAIKPVLSFLDLAMKAECVELAHRWANERFGADWEKDPALVLQATTVLAKFAAKGRDHTVAFLVLMTLILDSEFDFQLSEKYLVHFLGEGYFKDPVKLKKGYAEFAELIQSGTEVAQAYMRNAVVKVA